MRIALAVLTLLVAAGAVRASDFRIFGIVASDPIGITTALVDACNAKYPELATTGSAALNAWRQRNEHEASRVRQWLIDEMNKQIQGEEERKQQLASLERDKGQYVSDWLKNIEAGGISICSDFIGGLGRPESDLVRMFPK